jgi:UDP:flavonoid glycosyltransferase YjiC (YdhE family)
MKPRHIAIFTTLAKGHMFPALGFLPELIKRGYRISIATDDNHAKFAHAVGAEAAI